MYSFPLTYATRPDRRAKILEFLAASRLGIRFQEIIDGDHIYWCYNQKGVSTVLEMDDIANVKRYQIFPARPTDWMATVTHYIRRWF